MAIEIVIYEDDEQKLDNLTNLVAEKIALEKQDLEIVLATSSVQELEQYSLSKDFLLTLFIIDIDNISDGVGMRVAEMIRAQHLLSWIAIISENPDLSQSVLHKNIAVLDFIVKDDRFEDNITKMISTFVAQANVIYENKRKDILAIASNGRRQLIPLDLILYITHTVIPHELIVVLKDGQHYSFYGSLIGIEQSYPALVRTHRLYLINPKNVGTVDYTDRKIIFDSAIEISFSRRKTQVVRDLF